MPSESGFSDYRLPRGRHGLARELVAENQRWRLIGASAEVLAAGGFGGVTSSAIAARAGVSKGTFYEHFDHVEQCLCAAHDMAADCVLDLASDACGSRDEESLRLRASLDAVLGFLAAEPALANLLGASAAAGDSAVGASRERLIMRFAELLRGTPGTPAHALPPVAERRVVAAAFALLSDVVGAGEAQRLPALAPELAELLRVTSPGGTG